MAAEQRNLTLTQEQYDRLKKAAKRLKKAEGIPHHQALDKVAQEHGFADWAHANHALKAWATA